MSEPVTPVAPVVEEPVTPAPVAEVPPAPPAPVELPELRYEYQPTDEHGRALGGKQVIKYKTPDELANKLAAQNTELVRKLREVTRKQKLGIHDELPVPEGAEFESFSEPTPKTLTAEERFQLSQDINDPEKSVDAVNKIIEASVGLTAEQMRQQYNDSQMAKLQYRAYVNYQIFENQHKEDFYPCQENKEIMTDWMFKKGLAPTVNNFKIAHSTLKEAGLLLDSPIVREVAPVPAPAPVAVTPAPVSTEPNSQVPVAPETRISPAEQPQTKRQVKVPSGLNARTASDSGTSGAKTTLTLVDIEKMPADEYRRKLKDPVFRKMVDELDSQASAKRNTLSN